MLLMVFLHKYTIFFLRFEKTGYLFLMINSIIKCAN